MSDALDHVALVLIQDQHGYIRPGEHFRPGWNHRRGPFGPQPVQQFADHELMAQQLLCSYRAAKVLA